MNVISIGPYALAECSALSLIDIPNSVNSIGSNAFLHCNQLAHVYISSIVSWCNIHFDDLYSNPLAYAENLWLNGCMLYSLIIPQEVTVVGDYAFYHCPQIQTVSLPSSIKSIGNSAFDSCTGITSISIPESVTEIGQKAFYNCNKIAEAVIPSSVVKIEDETFKNCSGLLSVSIPGTMTTIGSGAFENCQMLTSLSVPNSVTCIGDSAFNNCTGLTSVTIPNSVTDIGKNVFNGCTSLNAISLPFAGMSKNGTSNTHFGYIFGASTYSENNSYVPVSLKTVVITSAEKIADYAFNGCGGLISITISDSVTVIGSSAFKGCTGLTSVSIPNSVTNIGSGAFKDCSKLESIILPFIGASNNETDNTHFGYIFGASSYSNNSTCVPSSLKTVEITSATSIGSNAFNSCIGLTSVTIPYSVTSIGSGAFYRCSNLESISLPFIGFSKTSYTFFGYIFGASSYSNNSSYVPSSLKTVVITSVTSIGSHAFSGCTGLTSITIPNSVTSISEWAFLGCTGLTSITIPDSVMSIGSSAFFGCTGLTSITILDSVISIGSSAFYNTAWYNNHPDGVIYAGKVAYKYKGPIPSNTSITLNEGTTEIAGEAFYGCAGLTTITIPDSVTSIGNYAFSGCNRLTSVTIPNSVTSIGDYAFYNCTGLTSVSFDGIVAQWNAISIGDSWKKNAQFTSVVCFDGTVRVD